MKLSAILATLLGCAIASPVAEIEEVETRVLEKRQAINYVQNYNGNLANFQYNEGTGGIYASWNNPSDFVIGLGWTTGTGNRSEYCEPYGETNDSQAPVGSSTSVVNTAALRPLTSQSTAGSTTPSQVGT
jgi:endo-1,4-beta-xylanase